MLPGIEIKSKIHEFFATRGTGLRNFSNRLSLLETEGTIIISLESGKEIMKLDSIKDDPIQTNIQRPQSWAMANKGKTQTA
jgi:hypothetical protein